MAFGSSNIFSWVISLGNQPGAGTLTAHSLASPLATQLAGEAHDSALGGHVARLVDGRGRDQSEHRRDVHDRTATGPQEVRRGQLAETEQRREVHVDHLLEPLEGLVQRGHGVADPGVVDQDVEATTGLVCPTGRFTDEAPAVVLDRHVHGHHQHPLVRGGELFQAIGTTGCHDHGGARRVQDAAAKRTPSPLDAPVTTTTLSSNRKGVTTSIGVLTSSSAAASGGASGIAARYRRGTTSIRVGR